jgi:hypothetical protein
MLTFLRLLRRKLRSSQRQNQRGDTVGRLRVIQIRQYEIVFQVEEFGFERQEVLSLPRVEVH